MNQHNLTSLMLLAVTGFFSLTSAPATADTNWKLVKQRSGISVYVIDVAASDIVKVKTQVVIDAPLQHIQQILDNVEYRKNWVPLLQHSSILQILNDNERLEYSLFAAPWPASDRDFTYRISRLQNSPDRLVYAMRSEITVTMPEQAGVVRAELIESRYVLSALNPQQTAVELVFHADLRGWLPSWIINIIQQVLPYKILENLRALASTHSAQKNRGTTLR